MSTDLNVYLYLNFNVENFKVFRVGGYVPHKDEADILEHSVKNLITQEIEVILLDDNSDDTNTNLIKNSKILYNLGKGRFNSQGIKDLPFFYVGNDIGVQNIDYIIEDLNGDRLNDLICLNQQMYRNPPSWAPWEIFVYEQQIDGSFIINKSYFTYTINATRINGDGWKSKLVYFDYNNDGVKDISYINSADNNGVMKSKSVFIRNGNKFIEEDYYQYDNFAKSLLNNLK